MSYREIELLIDAFSSMPGISKKTAEKICSFLIKQDKSYISEVVSRLIDVRENISICDECNNISQKNLKCSICNDLNRDRTKLVIVNDFSDIEKIEKSETHKGLYFILGCEINLKKKETSKVDSKYQNLKNMIEKNNFESILIATDLTIQGELTANYISNLIKKDFNSINIYRLAAGMPINSSLDYIDVDSLKQSILNKTKI